MQIGKWRLLFSGGGGFVYRIIVSQTVIKRAKHPCIFQCFLSN